ncbi:hypothetical protein ACFL2V_05140 [Pseudomonadota bacterium]
MADYGVYVTLVALMELTLAISSLGFPWLTARYMPDFRLNAGGDRTIHFIWKMFSLHSCAIIFAVIFLYFFHSYVADWLNLQNYSSAIAIFLFFILTEGISRKIIVESLLAPLLKQGWGQLCIVFKQLTFLLLLIFHSSFYNLELIDIIKIELLSSSLCLALAFIGLVLHQKELKSIKESAQWQAPSFSEMWSTARNMYTAHLVTLAYSPQAILLIVQRYLGPESTALLGFLFNLLGQVTRYLPATLLFTLIAPKLVATHINSSDIKPLNENANMAGKLNYFALMPIIAISYTSGDNLVSALSGHQFESTGLFLFFLFLSLIPFSQRKLIEAVAVTLGQSTLCVKAASIGVLILPLTFLLLELQLGLWAPVISLITGHLLFNIILIIGIGKMGYKPDINGPAKIAFSACIAAAITTLLPDIELSWLNISLDVLVISLCFLTLAWLIRPFKEVERNKINRLINRPIFIW